MQPDEVWCTGWKGNQKLDWCHCDSQHERRQPVRSWLKLPGAFARRTSRPKRCFRAHSKQAACVYESHTAQYTVACINYHIVHASTAILCHSVHASTHMQSCLHLLGTHDCIQVHQLQLLCTTCSYLFYPFPPDPAFPLCPLPPCPPKVNWCLT